MQLLYNGSSSMLLYVHRDLIKDYQGREAQDGHLHFHTAPELCCAMDLSGLCI